MTDLAAYVTLRGRPAPLDDLRASLAGRLQGRLPAYMVPTYIEVLDRIPTLASGKADRNRLPAPVLPRVSARRGEYVAPETDAELVVQKTWAKVFGEEKISVTADFFLDLGGHSLFAARVTSVLREQPEFAGLSIADLYNFPTIRSLAKLASHRKSAAAVGAQRPHHALEQSCVARRRCPVRSPLRVAGGARRARSDSSVRARSPSR